MTNAGLLLFGTPKTPCPNLLLCPPSPCPRPQVDVDISSSSVAASVTNLVAGATKSLTIDLGVLVEGQAVGELPEQLLGTMRLEKVDLKTAAYLAESSGRVLRPGDM